MGPVSIQRRAGALAVLPWGFCVALAFRYGYDAPYWDQWWYLPLIQKAYDGTWVLSDCWMTVNEHRAFFPALITVAMARATHWNHSYEHALILILATAVYGLILTLVYRKSTASEPSPSPWLPVVVALLIFSFSQWRNWMWGLHIMIFLAELCAVAAIALLCSERLTPLRVLAASLLALIATYSFGAGIMVWPVGLLLVLARVRELEHRALFISLFWIGAGAAIMAFYFVDYEATDANDSALYALQHPISYGLYIVAYIGGPIAAFSGRVAFVAGILGGATLFLLAQTAYRRGEILSRRLLPLWGLVLFALMAAALTGLKQNQEGIEQAISSRYITWPTLFWVGLVCLQDRLAFFGSERGVLSSWFRRGFLSFVAVFTILSSSIGAYRADEQHDAFEIGRAALHSGQDDAALRWLYPEPEFAAARRQILVDYELSLFRDAGQRGLR